MITLRDYQQRAIDEIYRWFRTNTGNPLVVMPTGAGKSVVIASFIQSAMSQWPATRVLMMTHVKELIQQNHDKLIGVWPTAPVGVYSASLRRRDMHTPILFGGIQSLWRKADRMGRWDLVIVDEAHLVNHKAAGMYRQFLNIAQRINPNLKVIGFTATPFRTSHGNIAAGDDRIFDGTAHVTTMTELLNGGYLSPLRTKQTVQQLDVSSVHMRGGEFVAKELEAAVDQHDVTETAMDELVRWGASRRSWLVFCASVRHAEHVRDALRRRGILAESITGQNARQHRDQVIDDYRRGVLRALVNVDVLTTGFDAPETDLLAVLRPTGSPGLYVQIMGRGMRVAPGKDDCLVLDFAGNVSRHGPVDQVEAWEPSQRTGKGVGTPPVKACEQCFELVAYSALKCPACGFEFPLMVGHQGTADDAPVLSMYAPRPKPQRVPVDDVFYMPHNKPGKPTSLRVHYRCGLIVYKEWVTLEHPGRSRRWAVKWWEERSTTNEAAPETILEALARVDELRVPAAIWVDIEEKYPRVVSYVWNNESDAKEQGNRGAGGGPGNDQIPSSHHQLHFM